MTFTLLISRQLMRGVKGHFVMLYMEVGKHPTPQHIHNSEKCNHHQKSLRVWSQWSCENFGNISVS